MAKVIVDDIEQAPHSGEISVLLSKGVIKIEYICMAFWANVKKGRENNEEITIFDSTRLAIEDIICAKLVYDKARKGDTPSRLIGGDVM